jgi:sugar/nucleoside kinase (ribokinase family)
MAHNSILLWGRDHGQVKRFTGKPRAEEGEIKDSQLVPSETIWDQITGVAPTVDIQLLNVRHTGPALHAAKLAHEGNVSIPVILDYSGIKPAADNQVVKDLIHESDYIFLPAEALLPGMSEPDVTELRRQLIDVYNVRRFAISDNKYPVYYYDNGAEGTIELPEVEEIDNLGCGDVRDAAFAFFTMQDDDFVTALTKASYIASFSVSHYAREWGDHLSDLIDHHEEVFRPALEPAPPAYGSPAWEPLPA